jgi:hypothetical protein
MHDFVHLTAQLRILVKHGPDHVVKLRVKALHELPQLSLQGPTLVNVTLLVSYVCLIQKVRGLIFVKSHKVVE